jgi:hypothetical protein
MQKLLDGYSSKVWGYLFFVSERGKRRKRIGKMTIEVMEVMLLSIIPRPHQHRLRGAERARYLADTE